MNTRDIRATMTTFGVDSMAFMIFTNIVMDDIFDDVQHDKYYERKRENV